MTTACHRAVHDTGEQAVRGHTHAAVARLREVRGHLEAVIACGVPEAAAYIEPAGVLLADLEALAATVEGRMSPELPRRFYVAWHPQSDVVVFRWKTEIGLAEWRSREWRVFPSAPIIEDVTDVVPPDMPEFDGAHTSAGLAERLAEAAGVPLQAAIEMGRNMDPFAGGSPLLERFRAFRESACERAAELVEREAAKLRELEDDVRRLCARRATEAALDELLEIGGSYGYTATRHARFRGEPDPPSDGTSYPHCLAFRALLAASGWTDTDYAALREHYFQVSIRRATGGRGARAAA